jgi:hypothetical protein
MYTRDHDSASLDADPTYFQPSQQHQTTNILIINQNGKCTGIIARGDPGFPRHGCS